jgi:hypothetical protein
MLVLLDSRGSNAKTIIFVLRLVVFSAALQAGMTLAQPNSIIMGYSGSGITSDLRRVIEKQKLWDKHGVMSKRFTSTAAAL